jgi:hypothetical protein
VGDSKNAYYVSFKESSAIINLIGKSQSNVDFNSEIISCHYANKCFYFMLKTTGKNTVVEKYDYNKGRCTEVVFGNFKNNNKYNFVPDSNGNFYTVNPSDKYTLLKYSSSGAEIKKWKFPDAIKQVETFNGTGIYIVTGSDSYKLSKNTVQLLSSEYIGFPIKMSNQRYFISGGYLRDGNNSCKAITDCSDDLTAICKNGIIKAESNKVSYMDYDGNIKRYYTINNKIKELYSLNNKIYCVTENGIYTIKFNELNVIKTDESTTIAASQAITNPEGLSSPVYKFSGKYIKNVSPKTSITTFKENISYGDYSVVFTSNGVLKTSGYVTTGMKVTFTKGSTSKEYTIVVMGDVTCDGKVNKKDVRLFANYLLDVADFSKECYLAADLRANGILSNVDLVIMARMCD